MFEAAMSFLQSQFRLQSDAIRRLAWESEGAGVDHPDDHDVPDGGHDGDPQPYGVSGHGLRLLLLAVGSDGGSVHTGRGVEQRVVCAVVIIRRVHEGTRHYRDLQARTGSSFRDDVLYEKRVSRNHTRKVTVTNSHSRPQLLPL